MFLNDYDEYIYKKTRTRSTPTTNEKLLLTKIRVCVLIYYVTHMFYLLKNLTIELLYTLYAVLVYEWSLPQHF